KQNKRLDSIIRGAYQLEAIRNQHTLSLAFIVKYKIYRYKITMAPRSQLEIATSSVIRLVKEEASYHKELQQQTERIKKLEAEANDDENREYTLKQEHMSLEETKKVLPTMKQKIAEAVANLEALIIEEGKKGSESNVEHITAAKDAIAQAKTAEREIS
ncbi:uncharacterized protein N7515_001970, partial [Penicillium bovifimosum]